MKITPKHILAVLLLCAIGVGVEWYVASTRREVADTKPPVGCVKEGVCFLGGMPAGVPDMAMTIDDFALTGHGTLGSYCADVAQPDGTSLMTCTDTIAPPDLWTTTTGTIPWEDLVVSSTSFDLWFDADVSEVEVQLMDETGKTAVRDIPHVDGRGQHYFGYLGDDLPDGKYILSVFFHPASGGDAIYYYPIAIQVTL